MPLVGAPASRRRAPHVRCSLLQSERTHPPAPGEPLRRTAQAPESPLAIDEKHRRVTRPVECCHDRVLPTEARPTLGRPSTTATRCRAFCACSHPRRICDVHLRQILPARDAHRSSRDPSCEVTRTSCETFRRSEQPERIASSRSRHSCSICAPRWSPSARLARHVYFALSIRQDYSNFAQPRGGCSPFARLPSPAACRQCGPRRVGRLLHRPPKHCSTQIVRHRAPCVRSRSASQALRSCAAARTRSDSRCRRRLRMRGTG